MRANIYFFASSLGIFSINLYSRACAEYKVTGPAPPSYSDGNVLQQQLAQLQSLQWINLKDWQR